MCVKAVSLVPCTLLHRTRVCGHDVCVRLCVCGDWCVVSVVCSREKTFSKIVNERNITLTRHFGVSALFTRARDVRTGKPGVRTRDPRQRRGLRPQSSPPPLPPPSRQPPSCPRRPSSCRPPSWQSPDRQRASTGWHTARESRETEEHLEHLECGH